MPSRGGYQAGVSATASASSVNGAGASPAGRPLGAYAALTGAYLAAAGGSAVALRRCGRELPERIAGSDLLLIGIAAHKISRLLAKDRVSAFVRAPFTRYQHAGGHGEVEEQPVGSGLRLAIGELLVCPYCLGQWFATALAIGLIASPRPTRAISSVFVAHTIADFLQLAYRAAEERA